MSNDREKLLDELALVYAKAAVDKFLKDEPRAHKIDPIGPGVTADAGLDFQPRTIRNIEQK